MNEAMKRRADETEARRMKFIVDLIEELKRRGRTVEDAGAFRLDGIYLHFYVREDRAGGTWSTRGTGRLRVAFGRHGDKRQFPEPKNGFDIDKIASKLCSYVDYEKQRQEARRKSEERAGAAQVVANRINEELGLSGYGSYRAYVQNSALCVEVRTGCTEDQARRILAAVKEIMGESK